MTLGKEETKEPHGPRKEEGKKGMFMDYIYLIMFINLFKLMNHTRG